MTTRTAARTRPQMTTATSALTTTLTPNWAEPRRCTRDRATVRKWTAELKSIVPITSASHIQLMQLETCFKMAPDSLCGLIHVSRSPEISNWFKKTIFTLFWSWNLHYGCLTKSISTHAIWSGHKLPQNTSTDLACLCLSSVLSDGLTINYFHHHQEVALHVLLLAIIMLRIPSCCFSLSSRVPERNVEDQRLGSKHAPQRSFQVRRTFKPSAVTATSTVQLQEALRGKCASSYLACLFVICL